jgi:hypothetical protein
VTGAPPLGKCRLCGLEAELRESHLLPRSTYALLQRRAGVRNPRPLFISDTYAGQIQSQFKDYLLCTPCEQRFSDNGETWVMGSCYRDEKHFLIREQILKTPPVFHLENPDVTIYSAALAPEIQSEKIIYFALSVFWRAAVHNWYIQEHPEPVRTDLGPFEPRIRRFLLGESAFPDCVALGVRVASPMAYAGGVMLPTWCRENGWHGHKFMIPGIDFTLHVGSKIPEAVMLVSFATSPGRHIMVAQEIDERALEFASWKLANAPKRARD